MHEEEEKSHKPELAEDAIRKQSMQAEFRRERKTKFWGRQASWRLVMVQMGEGVPKEMKNKYLKYLNKYLKLVERTQGSMPRILHILMPS